MRLSGCVCDCSFLFFDLLICMKCTLRWCLCCRAVWCLLVCWLACVAVSVVCLLVVYVNLFGCLVGAVARLCLTVFCVCII